MPQWGIKYRHKWQGGDEGWESVTVSNSEENYLQLYLLPILVYVKALIKPVRTVVEKGFMDKDMTRFVPQVCNSLPKKKKKPVSEICFFSPQTLLYIYVKRKIKNY